LCPLSVCSSSILWFSGLCSLIVFRLLLLCHGQRMPCGPLQIIRRPCMDFNAGVTVGDSSWTFSRRGAAFLSPGLARWRNELGNGAVLGMGMAIFDLVIKCWKYL
jgi:hypothetical protein